MMLDGKVAIVTGASKGIGRAIVDRFLAEGASVVGFSRSEPDGSASARHVRVRGDVASGADVERLITLTLDRFGGLDVLVNNAGVQLEKTIATTTEEEWDRLMAVNLKGVFLCCRAALAPMRARGGGSIVNIGSYDGYVADPGLAAYCASKGGVHALTRAIAVDHGPEGIRCNAICPGWIETEMAQAYLDSMADPKAARAKLAAIHPLRRTGQPADIAALAAWLAADDSRFVTGQLLTADGGMTAQAPQPR